MKDIISNIGNLFALSRDPVVCVDDGCIAFMNPPAKELFGEELIGKPKSAFLPSMLSDTTLERFVSCAVIKEQTVTITKTTLGTLELYSIIFPTITEPDPAFLSVASTVRNLANNINLTTNLIGQYAESHTDEPFVKYFAMLRHNSAQLKRLIRNYSLLNTFKNDATPFNKNVVDLSKLCEDICLEIKSLAVEKGISVIYTQSGDGLANVDSILISQMLLNLISNSLIHCSSGCTVQVDLKANAQNILLTVKDDGAGIPSNVLATVFQSYSKSVNLSGGGFNAGIGICVAYAIANLHNGALIIDSQETIGTKVMVQIPKDLQKRSFNSQKAAYNITMKDSIKTSLSTWLTWKDFIYRNDE